MIKINLLPAYVLEQEKVRKSAALFGVLVAAVIVCMLLWYKGLGGAHADLQRQLEEVQATEQQVKAYQAETQAARQESQGIRVKVKFINDIMEYNKLVPRIYEELARYTYRNILYTKVSVAQTQITIDAYTRSMGDAGKYLLNLYKASDLFTSVSISAVPGYPQAVSTVLVRGPGGVSQTYNQAAGELPYAPITGPLSGALASAESQQMMASETSPGFVQPNVRDMMMNLLQQELRTSKIVRRPAGFTFTVTCTLRKPINPPMYGQQAGAAAAQGTPGMPGTYGTPGASPMMTPEGIPSGQNSATPTGGVGRGGAGEGM